jgi:hypothetical protein
MGRGRFLIQLLAVCFALVPTTTLATCCLNGGPCNITTLVHGVSPWTGAVCPTTIASSGGCIATLGSTNGTATSGDCITIGAGVTLDLNGRTLDCTDDLCGSAIVNTGSGGGSSAVGIQNGDITGCWSNAINVTAGTNSSASDLLIDKTANGACANGTHGISYMRGPIDHVVIKNAGGIGIALTSGEDVTDSIVRNSGTGIAMYTVSAATEIDNVLLLGNDTNIVNLSAGSTKPSMQRSELQDATCDCRDGSSCVDVATCLTFTNSTTPSFVGDAILP